MTTGEKIREKRMKMGLTQDALAQMCGYKSRSSINKIEKHRDVTLKKIKKIATALRCDPAELLGWEENKDIHSFFKTQIIYVKKIDTDIYRQCKEFEADMILVPKDIYDYVSSEKQSLTAENQTNNEDKIIPGQMKLINTDMEMEEE